MTWMRLDSTAADHPKLRRLAAKLGTSQPLTLGLVIGAWLFALRFAPDGNLGSFSAEDLELAVGWHGESGALVRAMIEVRLLDETGDGLVVHDWADHAGSLRDASRKRLEREAKRKSVQDSPGQSRTVQECPPYGRTDGRTDGEDGEDGRTPPPPPPDPGPPSPHTLSLREGPTPVPQALVDELAAEWPCVEVAAEMDRAEAWLSRQPRAKQWTRRGLRAALRAWWRQAETFRRERAAKQPRPAGPRYWRRGPNGEEIPV